MSSSLLNAHKDSRVDVLFDILRRMLDEENILLSQLSYLVKYIHNPILERCSTTGWTTSSRESSNSTSSGVYNEKNKSTSILTFAQYWEMFANIATLHAAQSSVVGKLEEVLNYRAYIQQQQNNNNNSKQKSTTLTANENDDIKTNCEYDIAEPFCSAAMRHYIAEHMMYTLNYSRNIAPNVMKLWRRWRLYCSGKHANQVEQQNMTMYIPFLQFLWTVFGGKKGISQNLHDVYTQLPETISFTLSSSKEEYRYSCGKSGTSLGFLLGTPPIPADWRGFETLLALLAAPLASLRRYLHVARCLIESRSLSPSLQQRLQTEFVDVVGPQVEEECCIVLDELVKNDVAQIIALFDEGSGGPVTQLDWNEKKSPYIIPDSDGSRVLVHYGRLIKRFCRGRHERIVFLFSDWFCYVAEQSNGRMRLCASISLNMLQVVEFDDSADAVNGFHVVAKGLRFTFFASSHEEKLEWVETLRDTAEKYKAKIQRLKLLQNQQIKGQQEPQCKLRQHLHVMHEPTLSLFATSRLRRQQAADRSYQRRIERLATNNSTTTNISRTSKQTLLGSTRVLDEKQEIKLPAHSANGTFDVTKWAQQSTDTVHRRVRSMDLVPNTWMSLSQPKPPSANVDNTKHETKKDITTSTTAITTSTTTAVTIPTTTITRTIKRVISAMEKKKEENEELMEVEGLTKPLRTFSPSFLLSERFDGTLRSLRSKRVESRKNDTEFLPVTSVVLEERSDSAEAVTMTTSDDRGSNDGSLIRGETTSAPVVSLVNLNKKS